MEIPRQFSKYQILEMIGQGSMGSVFKAEQDIIKRIVAIKVLPIEFAKEDERKVTRFAYEAKSAARLFHPNIIPIFEVGKLENGADKIDYFVMQCFEGESLQTLIDEKKLSLMQSLRIFEEITSALKLAHEYNITHRDIKPSNIMVDYNGKATLLDFGIAKIEKESPDLTREGFVIGSAPYMSPEQARGEKVDGRSDIFSLGVVMYEAFTGQRAFTADNKRDMILDRQNLANLPNKQPIPMRNIDAHIPDYLEYIVHKCMEGDLNKRYQNSGDLLEDIKRCKLLILAETKYSAIVPKLYYHYGNEHNLIHILLATILFIVIFALGFYSILYASFNI